MTIPKHLLEAKICNKDTCEEIRTLKKENQRLNDDIKILLKENEAKEKVIIKYDNVLKILEKYFELIYDLGFDYDGLNTVESLKGLIDEMTRLASLGRAGNTTEVIYVNENKKYNILGEELKESDK